MNLATVNEHVILTNHARCRLAERAPGVNKRTAQNEVRAAIRDKRIGVEKPVWLIDAPTVAGGEYGRSVFAWTPEHERTYVLAGAERGWIVLTVYA